MAGIRISEKQTEFSIRLLDTRDRRARFCAKKTKADRTPQPRQLSAASDVHTVSKQGGIRGNEEENR